MFYLIGALTCCANTLHMVNYPNVFVVWINWFNRWEDWCNEHFGTRCLSATRFAKIALVLLLPRATMKRRQHTSDMHNFLDLVAISFPFFLMSSVTQVRGWCKRGGKYATSYQNFHTRRKMCKNGTKQRRGCPLISRNWTCIRSEWLFIGHSK